MKLNSVAYRMLGVASFSLGILGLMMSQMPSQVEAQQARPTRRNQRIVGGVDAPPNAYPWVVALEDDTGFQFCAGTLISDKKVLTAAHCTNVVPTGQVRIRVGSNQRKGRTGKGAGGNVLTVKEQKRHPKYRDTGATYDYDVAVWTLKRSVTSSATVGFISLPGRCGQVGSVDLTCPSGLVDPNRVLRVIGWGTTSSGGSSSPTLKQVDVPVVSNNICNRRVSYNGLVSKRMFCAGVLATGGVDSCQGDSGGPIFGNYDANAKTALQAGIVSWGEGCALPNKPGVYTRLSHPEIVDFITKRLTTP
jgi:trypsin